MDVGAAFWVLFALWNGIGFVVAAVDKHAAENGGRRVRERTFRIFAATAGGWGMLLACYLLRHKTRHTALLTFMWFVSVASTCLVYAAAEWITLR
ncbi:DUF1294 domain-containing protein [Oscillospiraceae bacterium OttesenSCG-928-F05]|nr:DUF1294 domain-containing protein [Oscillospiraceae bacterium OttesenSCG-928-F05]